MKQLVKSTFDSEANQYDNTTQYLLLDYSLILNRIIKLIPFKKHDHFTVLDLGCGTGTLIKMIKNHFPNSTITGLDFSGDMLSIAKKKNNNKVEYCLFDLLSEKDWPVSHFDVIISSFVFHNFNSVAEHEYAFSRVNQHLSVDGVFILADLIDLEDVYKERRVKNQLVNLMRDNGLTDDEIVKWFGLLELEDSPLSISKNLELLNKHGFRNIKIETFDSNNSIFSGNKIVDVIQLKSELLIYGVKVNECSKSIYLAQNPNEVWKTGNNGIFLNISNTSVLVGVNHKANKNSPYEIHETDNELYLTKWGKNVDLNISAISFPDWFFKRIPGLNNKCFSEFFVYEGDGFLHLAYKRCSFSKDEKCKFCSTLRRNSTETSNINEVCIALNYIIEDIPDDVNICLGGGTYLPLEDNVEYFKKIIKCIRNKNTRIPIWIEMIPPSIQQIEELINCGATSFGFNIEIWDDENRKIICPGKSKYSKEHYLEACDYVLRRLGPNRVGSCLIVGLDSKNSIKNAIDEMVARGIEPCILPYKAYNRTNLGDYTVSPNYHYEFLELSKYAAERSRNNNIIFDENQGCLKCMCCTVMHDYQK